MRKLFSMMFIAAAAFIITSCQQQEAPKTVETTPVVAPEAPAKPSGINKHVDVNLSQYGQEVYYEALFDANAVSIDMPKVKHIRTTEVMYLEAPKPIKVYISDGKGKSANFTIPKSYILTRYIKKPHVLYLYGYDKGDFKELVFPLTLDGNGVRWEFNTNWGENGYAKKTNVKLSPSQIGK